MAAGCFCVAGATIGHHSVLAPLTALPLQEAFKGLFGRFPNLKVRHAMSRLECRTR